MRLAGKTWGNRILEVVEDGVVMVASAEKYSLIYG